MLSGESATKTMPGLVQNWPAPRVNEPKRLCASAAGPLRNAPGRDEYRIAAGHLGEAGDGIGTGSGDVHEGTACAEEPVKATARMLTLDESGANSDTRVEEHRKRAVCEDRR